MFYHAKYISQILIFNHNFSSLSLGIKRLGRCLHFRLHVLTLWSTWVLGVNIPLVACNIHANRGLLLHWGPRSLSNNRGSLLLRASWRALLLRL